MRKTEEKEYKKIIKEKRKGSDLPKNTLAAFFSGGIICALGEGIEELYIYLGAEGSKAAVLCSCTLIFLGALLTGIGIYDKLASVCGAGTIVPITGFANAVASPAMEFRKEGIILGLCVKMFTVAGPVIVSGIAASALYGIVYYLAEVIF